MPRSLHKSVGGGPAIEFLCLAGAVMGSAFAGYVEFHNDEVQPVLVAVIGCSFILGVLGPTWPWRWGVIVGLGIPMSHLIGSRLGWHAVDPKPISITGYVALGLVGIVAGLIGAYVGAMLRGAIKLLG